ncbi:MAG: ATP-binding protein [Candidatus Dormibacteria bacterium]
MRLEQLELAGFGRLRDLVVDFGPRITVVLGDNEAGKSSLHRAVRAALYGLDAGGQGRPVERSEWFRWQPWDGGPYGVSLTYALSSGLRFRVARALGQRTGSVQVQEIGGGDVTTALRVGREVAPGRVHLGLDEAVFCASACLVEDSLRGDAPDAAARRANELQEAIERLADSGGGVSAAEALGRLAAARSRIGSERRQQSPLGAALQRIRQLDQELEAARSRVNAAADEAERLRSLEATAAEADRCRLDAERSWLLGRLADLAARRRDMDALEVERTALRATIAAADVDAAVALEPEERLGAMATELTMARGARAAGAERAARASERLADVVRRRAEIQAGLRALGDRPMLPRELLARSRALTERLESETGTPRRAQALEAARARSSALRREVAATGLGGLPLGSVESVAALVADARQGDRRGRNAAATTLLLVAGVLTSACLAAGLRGLAFAVGGGVLGAAGLLWLAGRLGGGAPAAARRELARRCPALDRSVAGLDRAAAALPVVAALHAQLAREQVLEEALGAELEESRLRLAGTVAECRSLCAEAGLPLSSLPGAGLESHQALLRLGRHHLEAIAGAERCVQRAGELDEEDRRLAGEEPLLRSVVEEAVERQRRCGVLEDAIGVDLVSAGCALDDDVLTVLAAYRLRCAGRRRLDSARHDLAELERRAAAGKTDLTTLQRLGAKLAAELRARGGEPDAAAEQPPPEPGRLEELEGRAEEARRSALAAGREAIAVRAHLEGQLDGLPSLAALEEERAGCAAARERGMRQLAAIAKAEELLNAVTRTVHRDVAPRLAASMSARLQLLSEGRYDGVNVDTDRFAVSLHCHERLELVPLELLSHGTRDQVALLLRLALTEVFGETGEAAPLLLDEPLLTSDPGRRERTLDFLAALAESSQLVLTTSDPALAASMSRRDPATVVLRLAPAATRGAAARRRERLSARR